MSTIPVRFYIDKDDDLLAMERSPIKDTEIKLLLKAALTDQINDREVYMKGVDASYRYEGYNTYKTGDIWIELVAIGVAKMRCFERWTVKRFFARLLIAC